MTTGSVLSVLRRRWYVVLLGVCLSALAVVHVHHEPGVYWTQVDVVLLVPKSASYPNVIEQTSGGVIATAGIVATEMNAGRRVAATSSAGTTLAGEGVRDGWLVRVPNSGGQWAQNFERPVIDVQVIGSDRAAVRRRLVVLVDQIDQHLFDLQERDGTRREDFITISSAPRLAQVFHLDGQPTRAAGATGVIGLAGSILSALLLDTLLVRRRVSRPPRVPQIEGMGAGARRPAGALLVSTTSETRHGGPP